METNPNTARDVFTVSDPQYAISYHENGWGVGLIALAVVALLYTAVYIVRRCKDRRDHDTSWQ